MLELRKMVKQVPGARFLYHRACLQFELLSLRWKDTEDVFTEIYRGKKWNGKESVSGPGSDLGETSAVRNQLPAVCRRFDIHTMLDIPCGDFNWMKHVGFESMDYTGADIVADLIQQNIRYEASNIHFCKLNLIKDKLPKVDMVLCRDCLVHFSLKDIFSALLNVCKSGSTYLLITTFTSRRENCDIITGQWYPLNLEIAPFSFPQPLWIINEESTERGGADKDKSLGLWRVEDIAGCLAKHFNS